VWNIQNVDFWRLISFKDTADQLWRGIIYVKSFDWPVDGYLRIEVTTDIQSVQFNNTIEALTRIEQSIRMVRMVPSTKASSSYSPFQRHTHMHPISL
jgi:glycine cleavage system protein P-like pyridoxal-binding family